MPGLPPAPREAFFNWKLETRNWNLIEAHHRASLAVLSYSYSVEGNYYAGFREQAFALDGSAERFLARYPAGMKVLIRYRADDPSRSVLREQDQLEALCGRERQEQSDWSESPHSLP